MPGFSLQNYRRGFRCVVLFIVYAGLLFSCGEGIRLCPFPIAENAQNNPSRLKNGDEGNYQKNIHRFENSKANSQLKSQKENREPHWADLYNALEKLSFLHLPSRSEINIAFNLLIFQSRIAFASIRSRAPPVS